MTDQNPVKNFRYALRDWSFKDGTKVPKGTYLFTNQIAYQHREEVFPEPFTFDPWRMYKKRTASPEEMTKHQYVMTGDKNLHFGHGKHACPGRFFAANEIKALLVLFLMRYDMRLSKQSDISWEEIKQGIFYSIARTPTEKPILEFKDRTHLLPEDVREWFV
jgi:cytochrome P450